MSKRIGIKVAGPTGWRGVMNRGPQRSDFGLSPLADNVDSLTQRPRVRVSRIRHGIGGGMCLSDEAERSLFTPSRLNTDRSGHRLSLTTGRAVVALYAASLVGGLLIAHVNLSFQIHDMEMQQHALQTVHRQLEREASSLSSRSADLGDLGRLKDFAVRKLQMVENGNTPEVRIASFTSSKYSEQSIAAEQRTRTEELASANRSRSKNPFRRLANMALAFAETNR